MPTGHIFVIAPNPDLRLSLAFRLEAEGYTVETRSNIIATDRVERFGAIVLDHRVFRQEAVGQVLRSAQAPVPVILLSSQPRDWLARGAFRTISTPLVGSALSDAVAAALGAPRIEKVS